MYKINRENLAWAAGFYDGEGCMTCCYDVKNKDGTHYRAIKFVISQSGFVDLLERFKLIIGFGSIYGPYTKNHKTAKLPRYNIRLSGFEKCQFMIALLWKHLGDQKRIQAKKQLTGYLEHINRIKE